MRRLYIWRLCILQCTLCCVDLSMEGWFSYDTNDRTDSMHKHSGKWCIMCVADRCAQCVVYSGGGTYPASSYTGILSPESTSRVRTSICVCESAPPGLPRRKNERKREIALDCTSGGAYERARPISVESTRGALVLSGSSEDGKGGGASEGTPEGGLVLEV